MTSSADLLLPALLITEFLHVASGQITLQYDITAMATNHSTNETVCYCPCEEVELAANRSANAPSTEEEALLAGQMMQDQLKLDKANLSSSTRRKSSAPDDRPSAQGIGAVGVAVLVSVVASIVILDLSTLIADVKMAARRLCVSEQPGPQRTTSTRGGYNTARSAYFGQAVVEPSLAPYAASYPARAVDLQDPDEGIGEELEDGDDRRVLTRPDGQGSADHHGDVPDIRSRRELLELRSLPQ